MVRLALTALALAAVTRAAQAPTVESAVLSSSPAKVCDAASKICYTEYVAPNSVAYRIAIPDTASSAAPFDIALSVIAPRATGWAAIAWGGAMVNNPLTVGWSNATSAVVSSRRATGHALPSAYSGASYTVLPSSKTNTTHWQLDVVCSGCSAWNGAGSLDPGSTSVSFAYASSASTPANPASNASRFSIHDDKGTWTHDLHSSKLANFANIVHAAEQGGH